MKRLSLALILLCVVPVRAAWWLEWDPVEGANFYRVWYAPESLAKLGQFVPVAKDYTGTNAPLPTMASGTTYVFRLTAVSANGESDRSDPVTFTAAGGTNRPAKPNLPRILEKP